MEIIGVKHLEKLKRKNTGNIMLVTAIDKLLHDLKQSHWGNKLDVIKERTDADCVYEDFYFFDINMHRTFILIEFEDDEATIVWCGSHDEYENIFKNNKITIKKWLKTKGYI
jgi:mRNA-degrading endonuclease HigB of HigAB toxin-antitoxin module